MSKNFVKSENENFSNKILECGECRIHIKPSGKYFVMNDGKVQCECCFMIKACNTFGARELIK